MSVMSKSLARAVVLAIVACGGGEPATCPDGFLREGTLCLPVDAGVDGGPDTGDRADVGWDSGSRDVSVDVDAAFPFECIPEPEICNGRDEDCDGSTDEDITPYPCGTDLGLCSPGIWTCIEGVLVCEGESEALEEQCEGAVDEDCDGTVDNGCPCTTGATRPCLGFESTGCEPGTQACVAGAWGLCEGRRSVFYRDADGDEFGSLSSMVSRCLRPAGFSNRGDDCDDENARANPAATAYFSTPRTGRGGWDFNCDGVTTYEYPVATSDDRDYCFTTCSTLLTWDGARPACGVTGTTFTCTSSGGRCSPTNHMTRTQRCR